MEKKDIDEVLQALKTIFDPSFNVRLSDNELEISTSHEDRVVVKKLVAPKLVGFTVESETLKSDVMQNFTFPDIFTAIAYLEPFIRQQFDGIRRI